MQHVSLIAIYLPMAAYLKENACFIYRITF